MAMQFRIVHTTRISYDGGVAASYNLARMTPYTSTQQVVLHTRLSVTPTPWTSTYRDYWGTEVTAFEVLDQHSELTVTGTSTVQVSRPPWQPGGLSWSELADPRTLDRFCETLVVEDRVRPDAALGATSAGLAAASSGPTDFARRVCRLVWEEMTYQSGSTQVHGHAMDAWRARKGVCQDMAHVAIGALRSAGVPARYVSGYLHPERDPQVGETVTGESHAWIEWWDGDWVGFDPTNDIEPGDRHVVVARGRDYSDVPPLTGIFSGGTTSSMAVDVQLTRLS
ncbi:MAG: transglutaminase family protein [Nocardioidaceae bacterium]